MIQTRHRITLHRRSGKWAQVRSFTTFPDIGLLCHLLGQLPPPWGHGERTDLVHMPMPRLPPRSSAVSGDVLVGTQDTTESVCPLLLLLARSRCDIKGLPRLTKLQMDLQCSGGAWFTSQQNVSDMSEMPRKANDHVGVVMELTSLDTRSLTEIWNLLCRPDQRGIPKAPLVFFQMKSITAIVFSSILGGQELFQTSLSVLMGS